MKTYTKPYLSIPEQVALLKKRGLEITDQEKAEHCLAKFGYYRLSGYSYVFRKSMPSHNSSGYTVLDEFKDGVTFANIHDLYIFDKHLRMTLLDAIERIEIALRVDISLQFGKQNPLAHLDRSFINDRYLKPNEKGSILYDEWIDKYRQTFSNSRDTFVEHFKEKYSKSELPIWMATELWDFGMLSKYYGYVKGYHKTPIAAHYDLKSPDILGSWLRCINIIRNICAHHGRLWNRALVATPSYPSAADNPLLSPVVSQVSSTRLFAIICIIQYLMSFISPHSRWNVRFIELVEDFPVSPYLSTQMMGMPEGWQGWALWRTDARNKASNSLQPALEAIKSSVESEDAFPSESENKSKRRAM